MSQKNYWILWQYCNKNFAILLHCKQQNRFIKAWWLIDWVFEGFIWPLCKERGLHQPSPESCHKPSIPVAHQEQRHSPGTLTDSLDIERDREQHHSLRWSAVLPLPLLMSKIKTTPEHFLIGIDLYDPLWFLISEATDEFSLSFSHKEQRFASNY